MGCYNSIIVNGTADQVWSTLRNFNDMSWAGGIVETLEPIGAKAGTEVGAKRRLNGAIEETLVAFDDDARAFSYAINDGPEVLSKEQVRGLVGTVRVAPITANGQSFVEWESRWDDAKGDVKGFCDPLYAGLLTLLAGRFA